MGATSVFRKVFSIFMAVVMVLTLQVWVPQNAFAEEPGTNGEGPQLLTFGDPDDSAETETDAPEAGQGTPDPSMAAMAASFELDKPRKVSWKDNAVRTIERLTSWMIYSMTFCFLFGVAGLDLSEREIIAYSLMLGLVVGSINNIERVMMELFKKED